MTKIREVISNLRRRGALVLALALSAIPAMAVAASAQVPSSTDGVKTAVTPYFTDLKDFAIDLIPYLLAVVAIGWGIKVAIGFGSRMRA